jgi:hypothetical protein
MSHGVFLEVDDRRHLRDFSSGRLELAERYARRDFEVKPDADERRAATPEARAPLDRDDTLLER